ncbi:hypothetical protein QYM36_011334, partial [Artemia franciscana]
MNRLCGIGLETIWTLGAILAQLLLIEPETFLESTDLKALESKYLNTEITGVELQPSKAGTINTATDEEHSVSQKVEWNFREGKFILRSTESRSIASREEETSYEAVLDYRTGKITGEKKNSGTPYKSSSNKIRHSELGDRLYQYSESAEPTPEQTSLVNTVTKDSN